MSALGQKPTSAKKALASTKDQKRDMAKYVAGAGFGRDGVQCTEAERCSCLLI